jgi:hypothetical protein
MFLPPYLELSKRSPLFHFDAIDKIVRVVYTHDLSFSMDSEAFRASMEDPKEQERRMKWRYRLEWRDPKRISQVVKEWKENLSYWWHGKGRVSEQLNLEKREWIREDLMKGRSILDRLAAEAPDDGSIPDREQWKVEAMKRIAKKHQADYDRQSYEVRYHGDALSEVALVSPVV